MNPRFPQIQALRDRKALLVEEIKKIDEEIAILNRPSFHPDETLSKKSWNWPLKQEEYRRYGRQMILNGFGIQCELTFAS
jgi:hypothetical protein